MYLNSYNLLIYPTVTARAGLKISLRSAGQGDGQIKNKKEGRK